MHENKICHRDLNPKNVLCNNTGTKLKIIDLGCAKKIDPNVKFSLKTGTESY